MLSPWKYVDDTTIVQRVPWGPIGSVQKAVATLEVWSQQNRMQLNEDKCKEMVIGFKKNSHNSFRVVVSDKELPVCSDVKVLGVAISASLKWNENVTECMKKAKTASVLHCSSEARKPTTISLVKEYYALVYHHALPQYLSDDIERVQKTVLSIIFSSQLSLS